MTFFDSHAHLTSSSLFDNLGEVLVRAKDNHVSHIVNICTNAESLEKGLLITSQSPTIYHAAAVHPHDCEKEGAVFFSVVEEALKKKQLIAVGETGLDYYYTHSTKELQKEYFKKHLTLALNFDLPVIIHCREAFHDFFTIIDEYYECSKGVLHCFTGTIQDAEEVLKRGWYISLSGIVTFKKSEELKKVAALVPLDRLLIETDAPFLAPQSKRGHPNEPSYISETASVIAEIKGLSLEELSLITTENAKRFFQLKHLQDL